MGQAGLVTAKASHDAWHDLVAALPDGADFAAVQGLPARAVRQHRYRGQLAPSWGEVQPVPWCPQGWYHAADIDPGDRLDYHTGVAYPQDAASQLPVAVLAPQLGEIVIDCCAAPGSKSTQIGQALGDQGLLICCDASAPRRRVLAENLARQGVINAVVTPMRLDQLAGHAPACADAVLVDAPCSGHQPRSHRQVARQAQRQRPILAAAAALVAPGGRLVYSTCTPYAAENEDQIAAFLRQYPDWHVDGSWPAGCDNGVDCSPMGGRLWPHRQGCEPFYVVRLQAPGQRSHNASFRSQLAGNNPPIASCDACAGLNGGELPDGWHVYRRNDVMIVASPAAASCALPSEARGLILARSKDLTVWGAQALIQRQPHLATTIDHATACQLWSGAQLPAGALPPAGLLRTMHGAPLGIADRHGTRLRLPARLTRGHLS